MTVLELLNPTRDEFARAAQAPVAAKPIAVTVPEQRDLRIDLLCGITNWFIFLDHVPNNAMSLLTPRNYGFSGAADLFIFVFGYATAIVYAKLMLKRGFVVGATRMFRRVWQLYAAYLVLFTIYIVTIGHVAAKYGIPDIIGQFNITSLIDHSMGTLVHGVLLQSRVLNLDILPLYIVLLAAFAPVLWLMMRQPSLTLLGSLALYLAARQFEWNLRSYPDGDWYFNPFCWQLLFVASAWLALGGAKTIRPIFQSRWLPWLAGSYLAFALVVTMAGRFPEVGDWLPRGPFDDFLPGDKANLSPYRLLHFAALLYFLARWVPKDWQGLQWAIFRPAIKCGQQALAVFCVGIFLAFAAHLFLITSSDSILMQVLVSATGIAIMILVAYYLSWSKRQDAPRAVAAAR
jgi:hypothetical protein